MRQAPRRHRRLRRPQELRSRPSRSLARGRRSDPPLHLAAQALARLTGLALALDRRLLVEAATLELLQDALLGHLLLEDLHRLLEAVSNLDLDRLAERILHGGTQWVPD